MNQKETADTTVWSELPIRQNCDAQQEPVKEVRYKSSKDAYWSELLGKWVGKSTIWQRLSNGKNCKPEYQQHQ